MRPRDARQPGVQMRAARGEMRGPARPSSSTDLEPGSAVEGRHGRPAWKAGMEGRLGADAYVYVDRHCGPTWMAVEGVARRGIVTRDPCASSHLARSIWHPKHAATLPLPVHILALETERSAKVYVPVGARDASFQTRSSPRRYGEIWEDMGSSQADTIKCNQVQSDFRHGALRQTRGSDVAVTWPAELRQAATRARLHTAHRGVGACAVRACCGSCHVAPVPATWLLPRGQHVAPARALCERYMRALYAQALCERVPSPCMTPL